VAAELGEHLTDEEVDKIFQKTDYDQDGYITAEDFYSVIAQREGVYE
jgi:Ca2+-binding EF-hand superfamily protein